MDFKEAVKIAFAAIGGFLSQIFGGFDAWLATLIIFMALDVVTGVIKGLTKKSEKTKGGGLDSRIMFNGGLKKLLIFVIIAVATALDHVIVGNGSTIRSITIGYYIASEGLSVLENASYCGLPLPTPIKNALETMHETYDKKEQEVVNE